jgi:hypothetical protein
MPRSPTTTNRTGSSWATAASRTSYAGTGLPFWPPKISLMPT